MWVRIRQQAKESGLTFGFTPSSSSSLIPPWHNQNEYTIQPESVSYWSARHLPSALYVESLTPALPVYCVAPQKVSCSREVFVPVTRIYPHQPKTGFLHIRSNYAHASWFLPHGLFGGMVAILATGSFLHPLV